MSNISLNSSPGINKLNYVWHSAIGFRINPFFSFFFASSRNLCFNLSHGQCFHKCLITKHSHKIDYMCRIVPSRILLIPFSLSLSFSPPPSLSLARARHFYSLYYTNRGKSLCPSLSFIVSFVYAHTYFCLIPSREYQCFSVLTIFLNGIRHWRFLAHFVWYKKMGADVQRELISRHKPIIHMMCSVNPWTRFCLAWNFP